MWPWWVVLTAVAVAVAEGLARWRSRSAVVRLLRAILGELQSPHATGEALSGPQSDETAPGGVVTAEDRPGPT